MNREQGLKVLQTAGLRLTSPRRAMLDVLLNAAEPLSAEEIHAQADRAGLVSDLSTVYRNLGAFVEAGLVDALPGANGERRYELRRPGENGFRLMCLDCGKMLSLPEADVLQVGAAAARQGFDPQSLTLAAHCSHECELD
jgi:Fe2+ or Zn2+ uptake regulation protein